MQKRQVDLKKKTLQIYFALRTAFFQEKLKHIFPKKGVWGGGNGRLEIFQKKFHFGFPHPAQNFFKPSVPKVYAPSEHFANSLMFVQKIV